MAQEIQILHWCDWCMREGEGDARVPGEAYPVAAASREVHDLDLCDTHAKAVTDLWDLLGTTTRAKTKPRGVHADIELTLTCPVCPTMFGTRAGVTTHLPREHGFSILQWEGWQKVKETGEEVTLWCSGCGGGFTQSSAFAQHQKRTDHEATRLTRRPPKSVYPAADNSSAGPALSSVSPSS